MTEGIENMASKNVKVAASKARSAVRNARGESAEAIKHAAGIREATIYTEEGQAEMIQGWTNAARGKVKQTLSAATEYARGARAKAEARLQEIRTVEDEEIAARSAILAPVISAAGENPTAIVNAYRKRSANMADRRLLEEVTQGMIDGQIGGLKFAEEFRRAQDGIQFSDEERAAVEDVEHLERAESYLASAGTSIEMDLTEAERPLNYRETFRRETAAATINRFENGITEHAASEPVAAE